MAAQRILVLGGGFAGLWSALAAARQLDQLGIGPDAIEVLGKAGFPVPRIPVGMQGSSAN